MRNLEVGFRSADRDIMENGATRKASTAAYPDLGTVEAGSPVFCVNGTDIGRVAAVLPDGFILERGSFLERQTYRVPATAVARITGIRVVLNVGCQELEKFRTN